MNEMEKAEIRRIAESAFPGVEVKFVTDSLYPDEAVAALGRSEAEEVCEQNCGWFDERINDCFNCNCPLALADKEAARVFQEQLQHIQQIQKRNAEHAAMINATIFATLNCM
jgi:hypothetical protein